MLDNKHEALTFDDFLIMPQFSSVKSRSEVNVNKLLVSANMKDITGTNMCRTMSALEQIGCLHRFMSPENNAESFRFLLDRDVDPWVSVGFETDRVKQIASIKDDAVVVVDVAHGYTQSMLDFILWIQENYSKLRIIAGNFVEYPERILKHSDIKPIYGIKIGVGPGSACTTRSVTGHGYPQFQAILNTVKTNNDTPSIHRDMLIIADGGCKSSGDIAKALAAGAHKVMIGGLLAFTDACNNPHRYAGSASLESYEENGKVSHYRAPEGQSEHSNKEPTSTRHRVQELLGGIRSAFSYSDSLDIATFHKKAKLIRVSNQISLENSTRKWT